MSFFPFLLTFSFDMSVGVQYERVLTNVSMVYLNI